MPRPDRLTHADWSIHPAKRWQITATRQPNGRYHLAAPALVGPAETLLTRLRADVPPTATLWLGVDFPLGVPAHWASQVGLTHFLDLLRHWGQPPWETFDHIAATPADISPYRPFYPAGRPTPPARHAHLAAALNAPDIAALRRTCDQPQPHRRAAAPLFWTLGAQQVGKAALSGWRELLVPGLHQHANLRLWPFHGSLANLTQPGQSVVIETYPAECYHHLGLHFGRTSKRDSAARAAHARLLHAWIDTHDITLDPTLAAQIDAGFGPTPDGEDPFDALIGLLGLLNVALGHRPPHDPTHPTHQHLEGWILGLAPAPG